MEEVEEHLRRSGGRHGQGAGRRRRSAAGLGARGRQVLDARHDGHGPEPRPERRLASRGWRSRPATSGSPGTPTGGSCRCSARSCWTSTASVSRSCLDEAKERKGEGAKDTDLDADDLRALTEGFKDIIRQETGEPIPAGARASSSRRRSRRSSARGTARGPSPTAARTRSRDDLGTAVNVVAMVFGNMGEDSGTGVAFTRDPATGEKVPYGDYLANAQGEDVVAGIRNTLKLTDLAQLDAGLVGGAPRRDGRRWSATTATCATSSSRSNAAGCGSSRPGWGSARRSPSGSWPTTWSKRASSARTRGCFAWTPNRLEQLFKPVISRERRGLERPATRGLNASPGAAVGRVVFTADDAEGVGRSRGAGDPGPPGDDPRRLPRDDPVAGHPDQRRRNELACRRRGARGGDPRRVRRGRDPHRARVAAFTVEGTCASRRATGSPSTARTERSTWSGST